jgi:hypothetical protein
MPDSNNIHDQADSITKDKFLAVKQVKFILGKSDLRLLMVQEKLV